MNENNSFFEIFPNIKRTELDPKKNFESDYEYLLRSGRDESENVRKLIDDWYSHYPKNEKKRLKIGLNSKNDKNFNQTFYELYIYSLCQQLDYSLIPHPNICDVITHPDFLCKNKKGEEFFLEATTSDELSKTDFGQNKMIRSLLDSINEIESPNFFLNVEIKGDLAKQPSSKKIKEDLSIWLQNLNQDEISSVYLEKGILGVPRKTLNFDPNFELVICVIPKSIQKKGRIIGSYFEGFRLVNTKELIRKAIKKRTGKYGNLKNPLLIAINVTSLCCEREDVIEALFGSIQCAIKKASDNGDILLNERRMGDGIFSSIINTRISAVIITHNIYPWNIIHQDICVYHNPWAKNPYSGELDKLPNMRVINKIPQWNLGCQPYQILKLPENWPKNPKIIY